MSLRVVVDATALPSQRVGAGTSVVELLRVLDPAGLELHVLANERDARELSDLMASATVHPVRVGSRPARLIWGHSALSRRVRGLAPDVFWGPHYTLPRGLPCPAVVTFHDPTFFTLPHLHQRSKVLYFRRAAQAGVRRAAWVTTPSAYSRRGAIDHAGALAGLTDVVSHGVDHERFRPLSPGSCTGDGRRPYILFVGALEPRKDVPTLVSAYERVARQGLPHELILAGPPAWGVPAIESAAAKVEHGTVRRLGFVSEDDKVALYQGASAFVYPSIAEGFGLPVLEAMACGTPVITTRGSAPEEIAGQAALLVEPRDTEGLSEAISSVLQDAELAQRLRRDGPARASSFNWTEAARSMLELWRRAASEPERS